MKKCSRCEKEQSLSEFHKDKSRKDGLTCWCKDCVKKSGKSHYKKHRELRILQQVRYHKTEGGKLSIRKASVQRQIKHPEKVKARQTLNNAIAGGTISRPPTCQFCGESGFVEGHHPDYNKPLKVDWLCQKCHMMLDESDK